MNFVKFLRTLFLQNTSGRLLLNSKQFQIKLRVYLDTDNTYKCKGRLVNSSLPEYSKIPIFLPKESHLSNLTILKSHQNLKHSGIKDTTNHVRSVHWIPKLRQLDQLANLFYVDNLNLNRTQILLQLNFQNFVFNGHYHFKQQESIILDLYF